MNDLEGDINLNCTPFFYFDLKQRKGRMLGPYPGGGNVETDRQSVDYFTINGAPIKYS